MVAVTGQMSAGGKEPFYGVDDRAELACLELVEALGQSNESGRSIRGAWQ